MYGYHHHNHFDVYEWVILYFPINIFEWRLKGYQVDYKSNKEWSDGSLNQITLCQYG